MYSEGKCDRRRPHGIRRIPAGFVQAWRLVRCTDFCRAPRPAELPIEQATKFELTIQSQDRQGARAYNSTQRARHRGRSDRVTVTNGSLRSAAELGGVQCFLRPLLQSPAQALSSRRARSTGISLEVRDADDAYAGGRAGDTLTRIHRPGMGKVLGRLFLVENVAGAGGTLGTAKVAASAPDGQLAAGDALWPCSQYRNSTATFVTTRSRTSSRSG